MGRSEGKRGRWLLVGVGFTTSAAFLWLAVRNAVGTYQWLGVASLGLLNVSVNQALAFTILTQATWYVPTTIAGCAFMGTRVVRRHSRGTVARTATSDSTAAG